jgi:hypothetical protein
MYNSRFVITFPSFRKLWKNCTLLDTMIVWVFPSETRKYSRKYIVHSGISIGCQYIVGSQLGVRNTNLFFYFFFCYFFIGIPMEYLVPSRMTLIVISNYNLVYFSVSDILYEQNNGWCKIMQGIIFAIHNCYETKIVIRTLTNRSK